MKLPGKLLWGFVAVLALGLSAHRAEAISLTDLLNPTGTLTVDDKIFSNFSLVVIRQDLDSVAPAIQNLSGPADASGINVTVQSIDPTHQQLTIAGGFFAGAGPGGAAGIAQYLLNYTVTTTNGLPLINDIELSLTGVAVTGNANAQVQETAVASGGSGQVSVQTPTNLGPNSAILTNGPFTSVNVHNTIGLLAVSGALVTLSGINETISEVSVPSVPEPTSVLLLGAGLAAIGIWSMKRRQSA